MRVLGRREADAARGGVDEERAAARPLASSWRRRLGRNKGGGAGAGGAAAAGGEGGSGGASSAPAPAEAGDAPPLAPSAPRASHEPEK